MSRRLLISTRYRAVVGGVESYLRALLPRLQEQGWEVALLYEREVPPGPARVDEGLSGVPAWSVAELGPARALDSAAAWGPTCVYQQGLYSLELEAALLERWPALLFLHAYYGACISGFKRHAFPRLMPCERTLGPGCLVHYLPRRCGGRSPLNMLREYHYQRRRLELARRYPVVAMGSHAMREEYLRQGLGPSQVVRLPLFSEEPPQPEPPLPRPLSGRVLLIGRLTNLKGGVELVRALPLASRALGRELELVVAGEGPELPRLRAEVAARGVKADFAGWVGRAERQRLMGEADVLAVPSVWPEPFGLVGLEAAAVGLPAVAYALGGITEWCEPGVSGELAPGHPPTVEGLAEALVRALRSEHHLARLREGAWRMAARFTPHAHVEALHALLEQTAARAGC
jgi:glycosyltransferase involved in cell wall biosynthesis